MLRTNEFEFLLCWSGWYRGHQLRCPEAEAPAAGQEACLSVAPKVGADQRKVAWGCCWEALDLWHPGAGGLFSHRAVWVRRWAWAAWGHSSLAGSAACCWEASDLWVQSLGAEAPSHPEVSGPLLEVWAQRSRLLGVRSVSVAVSPRCLGHWTPVAVGVCPPSPSARAAKLALQ